MAYSKAGSSSDATSATRGDYQVFLSFRGADTRKGFTDFLYHCLVDAGVVVFWDDEELRVGERIDGSLQRAITDSKIYICIFSTGYAYSKWCLRELALIVETVSKSKGEKSILPIFFDVEPDDVRLKTPLYSDDLLEHEKRSPDEAKNWRKALEEVAEIKGWNVNEYQGHAALIESVVQHVKLMTKHKSVPEDLIGLDGQINDLTQLLDVNHPDVRLIEIYGMGGIGKTTIAKVIFNQLCFHFGECCSFLENVRERSSTKDGIVSLQQTLLSDVGDFGSVEKINGIEEGMRRIGAKLGNKKVLLVLDDVDEEVLIKNLIANSKLKGGSRIIITTRVRTILQVEGFEVKIYPYEMKAMNSGLALQLFRWHAFPEDHHLDDYHELSREIVSCAGGLPLANKVLGSFLCGKEKEFWQETLHVLRKVPEYNIQQKLRVSYEALGNNEQQIFLDIACFFFNKNKTDAICMWDSCQFHPIRAIEVLTRRYLIKVLDNDEFWMHDQLITLGRQIVREESSGDLGKQSRLWIAKEALEIIRTEERKDKVQALQIDGLDGSIEITNEELERLPNLKFLKLGNGTFAGDFAWCRSPLRWISWCSPQQEFRANNMYLDHLVVFKLDKSGFPDDSKAWDLIKQAHNLKVLSLTECEGITTIPDFSKCLCLERLTLARCDKLKGIESFIGDLRSLIELEIEGCENLIDLPEEIGALVRLKRFSLSGCRRLRELPGSIQKLTSLTELDLSDTLLRGLPISIGKLKSLHILRFPVKSPVDWEIHDQQLPNTISNLVDLVELDLSGHNEIKGEIPAEIGELSFLKILNLESTGICGIPRTIYMLCHLKTLNLSYCHEVQELPELPTSLTCLYLHSKLLLRVPNLWYLTKLVELVLSNDSGCGKKSNLITGCNMRWIGRLSRLEKLELNLANVPAPPELASLSHLEELTLGHLDLETLVQLPSSHWSLGNLSTLKFYRCEVKAILLERLPQLKKLTVDGCRRLAILSVPLESRNLCQAWVSHCPELVEIQFVGGSKSLESLRVWGCESLRRIGGLSYLKHLEDLEIQQCSALTNVPAPPELASLSHLEKLTLGHLDLETLVQLPSSHWSLGNLLALKFYRCEVKAIPLERLPQLEKLTVDGCRRLTILSIPLESRNLCQAWVSHCPELVEIQFVGGSKSLESLRVWGCESLRRIVGLSYLKNLEDLEIQQCSALTNVEGLCELGSLKSLVAKDCPSLRWWIDAFSTNISDDCPAETEERGDFIKQGAASVKHFSEEDILKLNEIRHLLLQYTAERIEEWDIQSGPSPSESDMATSYIDYPTASLQNVVGFDDGTKEITDLTGMEFSDERMQTLEDEPGPPPADMETSDRNYAIAAVQNVVGIDDRAKQITDLLEMEVDDEVRIIGIHGTDGIGKTTLAKAVYDLISSCFDSRSFLAEVRETAQDATGIQFLQTKLIRDILERDHDDPSFDERIEDFLDIFRERKVLLVVDDVEEKSHLCAIIGDQLHRFGPGSRIIVTSQNEEILEKYDSKKARTYPVCPLEDGQAFELFCKHAFRMQSSIPDYDGLANRIVKAAEKLPLAVEVVSSFLRGKSIQEWAKMEKSMKERTRNSRKTMVGLEEILDICCKELDQQQKDIFLGIACFISGVDARIASYMWPNCHLHSSGCILMPLAKTGENNELLMHRLLRCLGKRICKQEESQDPRSRRFCTQDMVLMAMNREKGMGNVEALCLDFTAGDFQSMPKIRFLRLDNARVSGNFAGAFASLRWLCWQRCPLEFDAENLVLRELAILELPRGKITEDWEGWRKIKMPKLKVLNLTRCSDLLFTPDFSSYKDLEILILEGCSRLVKLDPSIGHLKRLDSLNLKFCSQLNWLPVELGGMTALKELFIDGTCVREMPISIGNLNQLETLTGFECFSLTHLPSSISYLTALSELSLDGAKITELPTSLGELLNLRRLSLRDCRYLEELPDSISKIGSSLEELDISATNISELPGSIGNLERLKVLRMDSSFIRAFPGEIGNLNNLEELHASWCRSLKGAIPSDIKRLCNLRSLKLGHSKISSLPPEISTIPGLHTLDLVQCNEIEELPKLPPSLIYLRVSSKRMKVIPLLEGLKELEELCLSDGDPKARRSPSPKWPTPEPNVIDEQSFSISFPKLRKLELSLSQVIKLQFGPTDDIPPPKRLKTLTHAGSSHKEVLELTKMLSTFKLHDSAIEEIEGLKGLKALMRLEISNCRIQNLDEIGQLTSLRSLILSDCGCLESLDLSNMKSLKVLEIKRCKKICQIEGLEKLTSLVKPNISECPALTL